jgi:hypothetical protein
LTVPRSLMAPSVKNVQSGSRTHPKSRPVPVLGAGELRIGSQVRYRQ